MLISVATAPSWPPAFVPFRQGRPKGGTHRAISRFTFNLIFILLNYNRDIFV